MSKNVFILDDEIEICQLIAEVCELEDFTTSYCDDSENYQTVLVNLSDVDIIFLDLNMPNKDGIEVMREFAQDNFNGFVVLMSGFDDSVLSSAGELAIEFGLKLLPSLRKPFTVKDIFKLLNAYLTEINNAVYCQKTPSTYQQASCNSIEDIKRWLETGNVMMHYQPQLDIQNNQLIGVESLVRLVDDKGEVIYPGEFIDHIENHGLNKLLLEKVVEKVCADFEDYNPFLYNLNISINVSALDLNRLSFPDELSERIKRSKLLPNRLTVEITETRAIEQAHTGLDILARLRLKGFHLSIDDFGTGEAVLGHIRKMPYSELKIDRSFVSQITTNPRTHSLTRDLIKMAQHLGLKIVAEGIEDNSTLLALKDMGCNIAQGFFLAKPMPINNLVEWMRLN